MKKHLHAHMEYLLYRWCETDEEGDFNAWAVASHYYYGLISALIWQAPQKCDWFD